MSIQVLSFNCLLKNRAGKLISSTFNRDVLNAPGPDGDMLAGLTSAMQDLKSGERRTVNLGAADAYGLYDLKKVILFPKKRLPPGTKLGGVVNIKGKSGNLRSYKVLEFVDELARLDGNHPLAGQDLVFEIEVLAVRVASDEEVYLSSNRVSGQVLH